ncbi:MAG TPA: alanine-zipper protein [Rhodanobacteraceae bacterium]|nr:alanine-zipper protein [Rhodanobacteraceae bacterium]
MSLSTRCFAFFGVALLTLPALAQQPPGPRAPTLEERVMALEASVATLDTRLELERSRAGSTTGQTDLALAGRVQALERKLERLTTDVQRVQRMAEDAARAASAAQRTADQAARDALR